MKASARVVTTCLTPLSARATFHEGKSTNIDAEIPPLIGVAIKKTLNFRGWVLFPEICGLFNSFNDIARSLAAKSKHSGFLLSFWQPETWRKFAKPMSAAKHREDEMEGGRIEEEEKSMTVPVTGLINGCLGVGG